MGCDVCGKTGVYLTGLRDEFQTDDIKEVCSECGESINDHLWQLRELTRKANATFLKRYIGERKKKLGTK